MDGFADYESDEDAEAPAPAAIQEEESESEEDGEAAGEDAEKSKAKEESKEVERKEEPAPKRKLPSALDALASGGAKPSFLNTGGGEFEVEEVLVKEKEETSDRQQEQPQRSVPGSNDAVETAAGGLKQPSDAGRKRKGGANPPAGQKKDVKDKVKQQRVRGQTLGGETKRWKSEGEMLLRQQFD
eukprot:763056-Hanusia_phi.AAC.10